MTHLAETLEREIKPWLDLSDELSSLRLEGTLSVPQIAAVGDQSSGKSSVLEALSGVALPRGTGLVTRCPIRLILRKTAPGTPWRGGVSTSVDPTVASVSGPGGLADAIDGATARLTVGAGDFSTETVIVRVSSPTSPDLTVVDLPGIVRTATAGQGHGVIERVNSLIEAHIAEPRTCILAVVPCNVDIATVDVLERAARVDPEGERTLGVLTKPDLVSPGGEDEVGAVLRNARKPLRLGYVMVKCRTQKQITDGVTSDAAALDEADFFEGHAHFGAAAGADASRLGTQALTARLTSVLVQRIQRSIAPMKAQVEAALIETRAELKRLLPPGVAAAAGGGGAGALAAAASLVASSPAERQKMLVTLTQEYVRHLSDCVRGEYRDRVVVCDPQLRLYTRALAVHAELQSRVAATAPAFKDPAFVRELATQMDALRGRELPGFMSAQSFYMFIQPYVDAWEAPAKRAAAQLRALALEVATTLCGIVAAPYPALRSGFRGVAAAILQEAEADSNKASGELLGRERDPFTVNDFLAQHINKLRYERFERAVDEAFAKDAAAKHGNWHAAKESVSANLREWYRDAHGVSSLANAQDMAAILEAYWTLAAKRFVDNVCMTLDDKMLGALCRRMQEECYQFVHDDAKLEAFFEEDPKMVEQRGRLLARRDKLSKANAVLANIRVRAKDEAAGGGEAAAAAAAAEAALVDLKVAVGNGGLGLQLAEDPRTKRAVVRGFRAMAGGAENPAFAAGMATGDVLESLNGGVLGSFEDAIARLKSLPEAVAVFGVRRAPAAGA